MSYLTEFNSGLKLKKKTVYLHLKISLPIIIFLTNYLIDQTCFKRCISTAHIPIKNI